MASLEQTAALLPEAARGPLEAAAQIRTLAAGDVVVAPGAPAEAMWIVVDGGLSAYVAAETAAGELELVVEATVTPGAGVGIDAVLGNGRHHHGLRAACATIVVEIPAAAVHAAAALAPIEAANWRLAGVRHLAAQLIAAGAPATAIRELVAEGEPLILAAGSRAVASGATPAHALVILSGELAAGTRYLGCGDAPGLAELALDIEANADAIAIGPVRGLRLSAAAVARVLGRHRALAVAIRRWVAAGPPPQPAPCVDRAADQVEASSSVDAVSDRADAEPLRPARGRGRPLFRQRQEMDCGAACLRMIAEHHGHRLDYEALCKLAGVSRYGTTVADLLEAAAAIGMRATAVEADPSQLAELPLPAIAHLPGEVHFVVIWKVGRDRVVIGDPAEGNRTIARAELERMWRGVLVLIEPTPALAAVAARPEMAPRDLAGLGRVVATLRPHRRLLATIAIATLMLEILGLAGPIALQRAIDLAVTGRAAAVAPLLGGALAAVAVVSALVHVARQYLVALVAARVERTLVESMYRRVLASQASLLTRMSPAEVQLRFREVAYLREYATDRLAQMIVDTLMVMVALTALAFYAPLLAAVVAAFVPAVIIAAAVAGRVVRDRAFSHWRNADRLYEHIKDALDGIGAVRALDLGRPFAGWMRRWLYPSLDHGLGSNVAAAWGGGVVRLLELGALAAVVALGARALGSGTLGVGALAAALFLATQALTPLRRIADAWFDAQHAVIHAERVGGLLALPAETDDRPRARLELPRPRGHVRFADVWFRHHGDAKDRSRWTLRGIELEVRPGEVIGVVGRSGSGKSTLVSLLLGLGTPGRGTVSIDGHDLRDVTLPSLRRQIGLVTQDVRLFSGAVWDNIACGRDVAPEAVIAAAQLAGAHEFVGDLPYGYDTHVGDKGLPLSGGQRQRLVIARALVTDPRILIFDEATAALDPLAEQGLHERLAAVVGDRTTFILTHRLRTLEQVDRIVVLDEGQVVEVGTHAELLGRRGIYHALATASPGWPEAA